MEPGWMVGGVSAGFGRRGFVKVKMARAVSSIEQTNVYQIQDPHTTSIISAKGQAGWGRLIP